ncbi:MAG: hypothetical protein KTR29_08960 [Rhodothermaceae bacterium]|nr:hypothetical protein [Rhodothermaceae bacterium]
MATRSYLNNPFRKPDAQARLQMEQEIEDELMFHLEMRQYDNSEEYCDKSLSIYNHNPVVFRREATYTEIDLSPKLDSVSDYGLKKLASSRLFIHCTD